MRKASRCSKAGNGLQIARRIKRGVVVDEVVIDVTEDSLAIRQLGLEGIALRNIDAGGEIQSPAKDTVASDSRTLGADAARDTSELHMSPIRVFPAKVHGGIRRLVDLAERTSGA